MVFAPDTAQALEAAVVLANTALEPDTLTSVEALTAFYEDHGYSGGHRRDRDELEAVRAIRPRLRRLLSAGRDEAVAQVNEILADAHALPRLVRHDALDWHIHAVDDDAPLADRVLVETAMAMVDVVRADEMGRLGVCAADDCDGLVLDLSRNRSRRYCSTTCGNREAVAAYRARQRA
jgi:predicted RNA-binding Zn ribbon-like protein